MEDCQYVYVIVMDEVVNRLGKPFNKFTEAPVQLEMDPRGVGESIEFLRHVFKVNVANTISTGVVVDRCIPQIKFRFPPYSYLHGYAPLSLPLPRSTATEVPVTDVRAVPGLFQRAIPEKAFCRNPTPARSIKNRLRLAFPESKVCSVGVEFLSSSVLCLQW
jgi:hypothetical protein